ncbi:class I SAM-dependent methyltransferase [Teredinibacter waterburyi]|uniref:class I SAM-dependent methyltransferase n=1 Tax=Teredinibacter waterburyi TaxID=1500538 RepID=UPI00165FC7C6|nr:class I SAM-dependent methyltransferase [Teredinibacter waterburyi]
MDDIGLDAVQSKPHDDYMEIPVKKLFADSYYMAVVGKLVATDAPKMFDILFQLPWYKQLHEDWLSELFSGYKNARVLEVGCGPGQLMRSASSWGHTVVGLDRSEKMLKKARKNLANCSNTELVLASADDIPYTPNTFDFAVAASLINVVDDPLPILKEMARTVKSTGVVSFLVPSEKMSARSAAAHIRENRLEGMSSGALRMWATLAKKMSADHCEQIALAAGLVDVVVTPSFDGMVHTTMGRKP